MAQIIADALAPPAGGLGARLAALRHEAHRERAHRAALARRDELARVADERLARLRAEDWPRLVEAMEQAAREGDHSLTLILEDRFSSEADRLAVSLQTELARLLEASGVRVGERVVLDAEPPYPEEPPLRFRVGVVADWSEHPLRAVEEPT